MNAIENRGEFYSGGESSGFRTSGDFEQLNLKLTVEIDFMGPVRIRDVARVVV